MRARCLVVSSVVVVVGGCDAAVDFASVVDGHLFGKAGRLLTQTAQIVVDFSDEDVVSLSAEAKDGDVVTDTGDGTCDRSSLPEQGFFETRLPLDNCVFVFEVTSAEPPEEAPEAIVIGFKNVEDDGSVEIDPSLDEDLPFPLSFADSYSRLDRVD